MLLGGSCFSILPDYKCITTVKHNTAWQSLNWIDHLTGYLLRIYMKAWRIIFCLIESGLFAAESEEEYGGRCNCIHLDCYAGIWDNAGQPVDRYYQRQMHSVGRLQQLRNEKNYRLAYDFDCILLAANVDGGLLLKNCLRTEK